MKTRGLNHKQEAEINITPMLDVVFIMLIFFIVTTSFSKETALRLFNTSHTITKQNKVKVATIKLDVNNSFSVNGVATKLHGIQSLLANLKASNPELKAQIISSVEVKTGDLVQAIHQVKENNIVNYTVSSF